MDNEPQILITPSTIACPGHGEHLRAHWPQGFSMFAMTIIQKALESEKLIDECRSAPDAPADVNKVNEALAKRPACYFVDRETIRQALMEAKIGTVGICQLCGQSGVGGAYSMDDVGKLKELPHVCFECALDVGERMHTAHPNGGIWKQ